MPTTKSKVAVPAKGVPAKAAPTNKTAAETRAAVVAPIVTTLSPAQLQLQAFERAVRLFSEQRFAEAAEVFRTVTTGPALNVADRARGYLEVCGRRLGGPALEFHSADDHFNYAVERLGARDFEKARLHLTNALKLQPRGDHILYTLALSCGMAGDGSGAYENLKRAIEVEPRNRIHARQDSDFVTVSERFPELRKLIES